MNRHHVPSKIMDLILDYCNNFRLRVMSGSVTSSWHCLEKGIITGCTNSVILFAFAMNMVAKLYNDLTQILWPLLEYDVVIASVELMERKVSSYLHRWLGLPRSLSTTALYGTNNTLQLPFSSITEEFMVSRVSDK